MPHRRSSGRTLMSRSANSPACSSVGDEQLADLLSAYIVAEDLALRQIQQEENLPLMRHVSIGGTPFDAICGRSGPDHLHRDIVPGRAGRTAGEDRGDAEKDHAGKKIWRTEKPSAATANGRSGHTAHADEEEQLRGMFITRRFSDTPVDVDIRLLDFEMLQKVYVSVTDKRLC